MIVKKILETFIDIEDPNEIFSRDRDATILNKLTEKFVGVCYHSCYVLKVNRIIRRSYIYMKETLDGDTQSSVTFEVDAIIYKRNEIINGCKIIKKEPNGITHAKSKYAGIQLSIQQHMSIFKEGDVVPIIVKRVRYNINQTAISILAVPFIPMEYKKYYYKLTGSLTKDETANITSLIKQINDEDSKISKLNANDKKIFKFFVDLLHYPAKTSTKNAKKINLSKILEVKTGILFKTENKYDDSFIYHESNDKGERNSMISELTKTDSKKNIVSNDIVVEENIYNVFSHFLLEYLSNLQSLQDFINHYPSFASVQKDKTIWKMYSMLKK